jgi:hypothetical protein
MTIGQLPLDQSCSWRTAQRKHHHRGIRHAIPPFLFGHCPYEQAALKCVHMAITSLDPTGAGRKRWTMRWEPALNSSEIAFDGRLAACRK